MQHRAHPQARFRQRRNAGPSGQSSDAQDPIAGGTISISHLAGRACIHIQVGIRGDYKVDKEMSTWGYSIDG